MAEVGELVKKPNVAIKFVEVLLGFLSFAVVIDGYPVSLGFPSIATIYGTQIGFFMISVILVMTYLLGTPIHKNILLIIAGVGGIMYIAAGALIISFYQKYWMFRAPRLAASAALAIINGLVYFVDGALTLKT